jgi:hypothetical protein
VKKYSDSYISFDGTWLGDVVFSPYFFKKSTYDKLKNPSLPSMTSFEKHHFVGAILLEEILSSNKEFLLPAIVDFIKAVREEVIPSYMFSSFELYINNYANLSEKQDLIIRGKIVGRFIPRSEYQTFFPIGMGGSYKGSHFSLAHFSPDVDTITASFHGFLDAFAAKVGQGVHYWQVPQGPPPLSVEIETLFYKPFGKEVFNVFAHISSKLSLSSLDLFTQKDFIVKKLKDRSLGLETERSRKSVIVVGDKGEYLADWRSVDFDEVRMVINNFVLILRLFEKHLYILVVNFFSKNQDLKKGIDALLHKSLEEFVNVNNHDHLSRQRLFAFMEKVLGLQNSEKTSIYQFFSSNQGLKEALNLIKTIDQSKDIGEVLNFVHEALFSYSNYLDSLEIAIAVKQKILQRSAVVLSHLDDYETIFEKMEGYSHLTVVHEDENSLTPLGVIHAKDIKGGALATVSIRDFSNGQEMDKAHYIDVISCIDHHKSELKTNKPARVIVSDAQSSNSIVAKMNMDINTKYSTGGYSLKEINQQIEEHKSSDKISSMRIMKRLLSKKQVILKNADYFVSEDKEFLDYYHFLFAILDDTDLLTKVTPFDVNVVCDLLNKMKSLMLKKEVEIVNFDDLEISDSDFAQKAARKLLSCHDLYSLYKENYEKKEKNVEEILKKASTTSDHLFFSDTKIIEKYAQIGQFKLFSSNHATFKKKRLDILKHWLKRCSSSLEERADLSIFIFMITTIDSAQDLFSGGKIQNFESKDEIWICSVKDNRESYETAKRFIASFLKSPKMLSQAADVHLHGNFIHTEQTLHRLFPTLKVKVDEKSKIDLAEIFVELKSIKSRKADIAPYIL